MRIALFIIVLFSILSCDSSKKDLNSKDFEVPDVPEIDCLKNLKNTTIDTTQWTHPVYHINNCDLCFTTVAELNNVGVIKESDYYIDTVNNIRYYAGISVYNGLISRAEFESSAEINNILFDLESQTIGEIIEKTNNQNYDWEYSYSQYWSYGNKRVKFLIKKIDALETSFDLNKYENKLFSKIVIKANCHDYFGEKRFCESVFIKKPVYSPRYSLHGNLIIEFTKSVGGNLGIQRLNRYRYSYGHWIEYDSLHNKILDTNYAKLHLYEIWD